jgi:uncharacterized membrane protein
MRYVIAYIATATIFLAADAVWLGWVARAFYRDNLQDMLLEKPLLDVAALFYGLYVVGIVIFGVMAGMRDDTWRSAALYGALFGLFAYATYDLTNLATLKNWPMAVSAVDTVWGAFVTALAATGGYFAASYFD